MGFRFGSLVALCALMGLAQAAPVEGQDQPTDQQERGRGTQMFAGGAYDNAQLQDDWFYDSYSNEKGFGADYYQQDNLSGTYDQKADENDWFFDSYEMVEEQGRRTPSPRTPRLGERDQYEGGQQRPEGQQGQQGQEQQETIQLDGTVEAIKQVAVADSDVTHDVVLLSKGDDRWVVDLGPSEALGEFDIMNGDRLMGEGHIGRVGGRAVVFADRIDAKGQKLDIEQDLKLEASPIPRSPGRGEMYTGEILRLKNVNVENGRNTHTVALVETEDGQQQIVDLGPSQTFDTFNLNEGDNIDLQGRQMLIGEHLVIWADSLEVEGEQVDLRQGPQRGGQQQGGQQGGQPRGGRGTR